MDTYVLCTSIICLATFKKTSYFILEKLDKRLHTSLSKGEINLIYVSDFRNLHEMLHKGVLICRNIWKMMQ